LGFLPAPGVAPPFPAILIIIDYSFIYSTMLKTGSP